MKDARELIRPNLPLGNRPCTVGSGGPRRGGSFDVEPSRLRIAEKIFTGIGASSLEVDPQTDLIYVGKRFGNEVSIIEPRSLMFIDTIGIEGSAANMTIDDEENSLFVVIPENNALQKINLTSKKNVSHIEVGKGAYAVVVMGER